MRFTLAAAALLLTVAALAEPEGVTGDWPSAVDGWVPIQPGEHPRLLFRKSDLPAIRKRAETPEGKAIVERLKQQLDRVPYTTWHASGYAMLWQLTGDKQYADKAAEMAKLTLNGKGNPDGRYTWPGNGQLRAGPCLWGMGLAYDLGYDAWTPEFRKAVAQGIMKNKYFTEIPNKPRHCPGCNHWGAHTGGAGCAMLALRGDPEVDNAVIEDYLAKIVKNAKREIAEGYGLRGYYYEGHHCGRLSSNTGLIPFIQAYRIAAGQDLVKNCENAQWLTAKWIYELFVQPDGSCGDLERGMYCRQFQRAQQMSSDGDFAEGFGIIPEKHRPHLLWTFNNVVCPKPEKDYDVVEYPIHGVYSIVNWPIGLKEQNPGEVLPNVLHDKGPNYFIFRSGWTKDGSDLVVTALMGSSPKSGRGMGCGGSVYVGGRGLKSSEKNADPQPKKDHFYRFPGMFHHTELTYSKFAKDGSAVVTGTILKELSGKKVAPLQALGKKPTSLAVDFSKASGADLLVAMTGPQIGHMVAYWMQVQKMPKVIEATGADGWKTRTVRLGPAGSKAAASTGPSLDADVDVLGNAAPPAEAGSGLKQGWYVMTLQKGNPPAIKESGGVITVGKQTLKFDGKKIILGTMGPELKLD